MPSEIQVISRADLDRLCDIAGRMGLKQLPMFRAAADGLLALVNIEAPTAPWPAREIERYRQQGRPTCVVVGADPGVEFPDPPPPAEWACARRLKYWCAAAIIHGAGGELEHYRQAVGSAILYRRLAFVECTSARAPTWRSFLSCPRSLMIVPLYDKPHPVPENRPVVQ
jgi:hypothetical protein